MISLQFRSFAYGFQKTGKGNLSHMSKRERKWQVEVSHSNMKDFTKHEHFKKHMDARQKLFDNNRPKEKLS